MQLYLIAGVAAVFAMLGVYQAIKTTAVNNERVRVEKKALKTDAKAQTARRAATAQPDGVLSKYYRD
jgi:hypothetical protein